MFGSGSLFELASTQPLRGSERGRVNVLLIGYSVDDPGHPAAKLTDSLMVLSMSTSSHKGYILSIPRDLYVNIPGHGYAKINEAYQDGGPSCLAV
jgi:anionic cell wall polymer biosynthesis LytR-Cps2A-Psr (LCP) family protein